MVEFVEVCASFMVSEVFVSNQFRDTITVNFCRSFRDNQFCEILFALKRAGYLCLTRDVVTFVSNGYEPTILVLMIWCLFQAQHNFCGVWSSI